MEEMKVLTRKNIRDELLSLLRMEIKSRKIHKLPTGFYDSYKKILNEYEQECERAIEEKAIDEYLRIKEEKTRLENDFRDFLNRRLEKICSSSPYEVDRDALAVLSGPEKALMLELQAILSRYSSQFLGGEQ